LLESELFGYEQGAFTGAKKMKRGLFELADEGTLFLDEIGNMKEDLQAKLLRAIETRSFTRVGGIKPVKIDARYISATNRDIRAAMRDGKFREDLFYRLGVFVIRIPPLRERRADIKLFIVTFLTEFHQKWGKPMPNVSAEAMDCLESYSWPGNTRELRNVMERAMILCNGSDIMPHHLPSDIGKVN
jgi:transcriptional regulator with PAS, ATPase and Fis domain